MRGPRCQQVVWLADTALHRPGQAHFHYSERSTSTRVELVALALLQCKVELFYLTARTAIKNNFFIKLTFLKMCGLPDLNLFVGIASLRV